MGGECKVAVVPVTADPVSFESAISSLLRAHEELSFTHALILYTVDDVKPKAESIGSLASRLLGGDGVVKVTRQPQIEPCRRGCSNPVDKMLETIYSSLEGLAGDPESCSITFIISPASRLQAALMALSVARRTSGRFKIKPKMDVVHISFFFGPWQGLVYPFTLRSIQPLTAIHLESNAPEKPLNVASRVQVTRAKKIKDKEDKCVSLEDGFKALSDIVKELPPLRCSVALLAKRINELTLPQGCRYILTLKVETGSGRSLGRVRAPLDGEGAATWMKDLAKTLQRVSEHLSAEGAQLQPFAAWAGAAPLIAFRKNRKDLRVNPKRVGAPLVIDTTAIYHGIHVYAWDRLPVMIPECAEAEIERRYTEALKTLKHGRRRPEPRDVMAGLAYLAFQDLKEAGAKIVPSPPGPCDTAIPKIDPVILKSAVPATGDSGAYEYWRRHPSSKIYGEPVKLFYDVGSEPRDLFGSDVELRSYALYALLQSIILLCVLEKLGLDVRLQASIEGEDSDECRGARLGDACKWLLDSVEWGVKGSLPAET